MISQPADGVVESTRAEPVAALDEDRQNDGTLPPPYDIYVLGLGIMGYLQVTRETEDALRSCRKVFYLHTEPYVVDYLRELEVEVEDLLPLYRPWEPRLPMYERMAQLVLDAAREKPPVALALYGHPMMFVAPSRMIREAAPKLGLRAQVLPGISALDCLMVDLNFDPGASGLVQFEANYALLYRPELDPAVPCLLWQPGAIETRLFAPSPSRPERFIRLRDYLLQFYPGDHQVALATSAMNPLVDPEIIWVPIQELPDAHRHFTGLTTLYIPPAANPTVRDPEVLQLLNDPDHIRRITYADRA